MKTLKRYWHFYMMMRYQKAYNETGSMYLLEQYRIHFNLAVNGGNR